MTKKIGRPTLFTQELADKICEELSMGHSLRTVCKAEDLPEIRSVFRWLRTNESFCQQYEKAKQESTDALAEEILDIADENGLDYVETEGKRVLNHEHINRSRLRVDTRKWLMSKMKPKKYGEKLDLTTKGDKLPSPIYGGQAVGIQGHDSDKEDILTDEED